MSTRSRIGIKNSNGTITSIYCHFDGYPDGVGAVLKEHYNDENVIQKFINLGDMSFLTPTIDPNPNLPHSFDKPQKGVTVFYGRDRQEENINARISNTEKEYFKLAEDCWGEYAYLWENGKWKCFDMDETNTEIDLYSEVKTD